MSAPRPQPASFGYPLFAGTVARYALRLSPTLKLVGGTAAVSLLGALITVAYTGVLAKRFGPEIFGQYFLSLRTASVLLPLIVVAMDVALARYVAITPSRADQDRILLAGLSVVLLTNVLFCLVGQIFAGELSALLLGSPERVPLLVSIQVLMSGQSLFMILYGYHRGIDKLAGANLWLLILGSVVPAAVVYLLPQGLDPAKMLRLTGLSNGVAIVLLAPALWRAVQLRQSRSHLSRTVRMLLKYGIPRAPIGTVLLGLYAFGPYLASHYLSFAEAGLLLSSQIVFRMAELGTAAFGIVILPKAAMLEVGGQQGFLGHRIKDIIQCSFHVGLFLSCQLLFWTEPLILVWLGSQYTGAVSLMKVLSVGIIPWIIYVMLRAIIDGVEPKPINALNVVAGATATVVCSIAALGWHFGTVGLASAIALGQWIIGLLTILYLQRRYRLHWRDIRVVPIVIANALLMLLSWGVVGFWPKATTSLLGLICGFLYEAFLFALYLLFLWKIKTPWVSEIAKRVLVRTA